MPGSLSGMVLADHGADVIRLESPAGDPTVSQAGERLWGRGKSRIALDMSDERQRSDALALIAEADVLILAVRATTAERWGLTYDTLSQGNPGLVFATLTGFGWDGPLRDVPATEALVHAVGGIMNMLQTGGLRDGTIFIAPHMAAYAAAMISVQGILAALRERDANGRGQHVDVGLYQAMLVYRGSALWNPEFRPEDFLPPVTTGDPRGTRPLFNLNECADGRWLSMGAWTPLLTRKALELMDLEHLLSDPRFAGMPNVIDPPESRWELLETLWAKFRTKPLQEWLDLMDSQGIPSEPALSVSEFRNVKQLWANDLAVRVDDPVVGPMVQQGVLGALTKTPGTIRPAEAQARPASEATKVAENWRSNPAVQGNGVVRRDGRGPLAGVRVLDLTVFLSGPMAAHLLTDLGADVVKLEPPSADDFRKSVPTAFRLLHRDKKGVMLDLKTPEGQEGLEQLVRDTDVVVYNFRLGVEDRLGLGYDRLKEINPDVIVCRITAFGPKGERAHRGGYDASVTALSGMFQLQAGKGNQPVAAGMADISTGLAGATAMSLAIRAKETLGVGQSLEVSMIGAMAYVGADAFVDYEGKPADETMDRDQQGLSPFYRLYRTADGWLLIAAVTPSQEAALRQALDVKSSEPLAFDALDPLFAADSTNHWLGTLRSAGVTCADATADAMDFATKTPELLATSTYITLSNRIYGDLGQVGPAVRFSRTPVRIERQEPELGEHNAELLRGASSVAGL